MQLKWVAICLLNQIGNEPEEIGKLHGLGFVSIDLATPFEQLRNNTAQLFTKIEFRSAKALNER